MFDTAAVIADLTRDEGTRLFVYDDATGKFIRPGSLVQGHPTIDTGRALDTHGISGAESSLLLSNDSVGFEAALKDALPWVDGLDPLRANVLVEMSFNLGVSGLLGFRQMLDAVQAGDWIRAKANMVASHWFTQVGARGARLANVMLTGRSS